MHTDRLLTLRDTRQQVRLSRSKLYVLLAGGGFPAPTKIGRNNYFSEREIQQWIRDQLETRSQGASSK